MLFDLLNKVYDSLYPYGIIHLSKYLQNENEQTLLSKRVGVIGLLSHVKNLNIHDNITGHVDLFLPC